NRMHTPILLLTAKGQISDKVEGLDAGADDYLVKPFAFEELLARVKALLRRPAAIAKTSVLKVSDLTLDSVTYQVKRAGKRILLSQKEFMLLEYLLRHKDKVIAKNQIINHVWDYDANILPNTVEVYIKHLRSKIDAPFKKNLVHTIRGFGYMIGEDR
ncbi:MAG TPA: response regulator transcription factor, partial [Candidatus Saccharimonadales bacterium]|nr:response regulator transcription factor [Candidatus Saccharimonadales bacterium]